MQIKFEYLICWGRGFLYEHKHGLRRRGAILINTKEADPFGQPL